jgi:hypothetical protein
MNLHHRIRLIIITGSLLIAASSITVAVLAAP